MTNKEFALQNQVFRKACEIAKVKPTRRQASKWLNRKGSAYKMKGTAISWGKRNHVL
jgi:hypothetical protein